MKIKYLKILVSLIIFTALCAFINSHKCINIFFEPNETFWTDVYHKGDTLIFANINNRSESFNDTIFIIDKRIYKPQGECNPVEVSNYDSESCIIDYSYKHDSVRSESDYLIQHVKENREISIPVIRVYGLEYSGEVLKDTCITLNITGIKLNDCYSFHKSDCYNSIPKFGIKTFIWSKKNGLVMFVGDNGEKFELLKNLQKTIK
ncbi:MAG: hypothetical protein DI539_12825 [Flavobacterium psychrophilum]|nr:MAG: hypothetical protein DI539_12825 [Flavobacterium psychrophilum]